MAKTIKVRWDQPFMDMWYLETDHKTSIPLACITIRRDRLWVAFTDPSIGVDDFYADTLEDAKRRTEEILGVEGTEED